MCAEDIPTNTVCSEHLQAVVARAYSRRGFLAAGLGLSAAMFLGGPLSAYAKSNSAANPQNASKLLGFDAIPISVDDTLKIAAGYTATVFAPRSEEHTSELQSLMRISYAVFCLKKKITT